MKGKQLLILVVLVVVLGGIGIWLQKRKQSSWSESGSGAGAKVIEFPINDVTHVIVKNQSGELNLVRSNDEWTVRERGDYPANYEQVTGLLRRLWDLKTVQTVKVGPSQFARLELVEPGKGEGGGGGTLLELRGKDDAKLGALLLGKKYLKKSEDGPMEMEGFPAGRYVMPAGGNKVSLVSETMDDVEPKPERWLRKDFIKVENPKSIAMAGTTDPMHWTVARDNATAEWKLADAKPEEKLDQSKVSPLASALANPSFKDVLAADAKPEETGFDKPATVTVNTFDDFTYVVKLGKLTNDAYPMQFTVSANLAKERTPAKDEKAEDKARLDEEFKTKIKRLEENLAAEKKLEPRTYLVEKFSVEPLLKERAALLVEKKPETPPPTGAPAAPGAAAPQPPISVTTPPVSIPSAASAPVPAPPAPKATPKPAGTKGSATKK
ncbi:MAG TPA: DUF4340 domain-containing protein [Chthoniobacteraceae bacterium]|nr:DUF4340 domain-containing protein [Chthoniobacteraceae bacterium]